jgi:hypothetical protein
MYSGGNDYSLILDLTLSMRYLSYIIISK